MWQKIVWLTVGGSLGTLARYGLSGVLQRHAWAGLPWGTLAVNVTGCFLFGLLWAVSERRVAIHPDVRLALMVGFLGAFTTFSTYLFESCQMMRDAQWSVALLNLVVQNVLGIVLFFVGQALGELV